VDNFQNILDAFEKIFIIFRHTSKLFGHKKFAKILGLFSKFLANFENTLGTISKFSKFLDILKIFGHVF
jgi:hypothetical protein